VGRLKKHEPFERVDEEIPWILGSDEIPKYLGDDMVLLLGLTNTKAEEMITEEIEHGASLFHTLEKWNPDMRPGNRMVRIQCWGIPLLAWDIGNISKIVAAICDLVDIDDDVEERRRLDRARILIRTPWQPLIHHSVAVLIGGETHIVQLVEETHSAEGRRTRHWRSFFGSSEEIISDGSDFDTPLTGYSSPSPRFLAADSMDGSNIRWVQKIPSGLPGNEYPAGIEGSSKAHGSILDMRMTECDKGTTTVLEAGPMSEEIAISGEGAGGNAKSTANVGEKKESVLCELAGCRESIYGKAEHVLETGQQEVEGQNLNGSQKT